MRDTHTGLYFFSCFLSFGLKRKSQRNKRDSDVPFGFYLFSNFYSGFTELILPSLLANVNNKGLNLKSLCGFDMRGGLSFKITVRDSKMC